MPVSFIFPVRSNFVAIAKGKPTVIDIAVSDWSFPSTAIADTIIFSTAHKEYRKIDANKLIKDVKKDARVIDLWNIFEGKLENKKNIDYMGLGRGDLR